MQLDKCGSACTEFLIRDVWRICNIAFSDIGGDGGVKSAVDEFLHQRLDRCKLGRLFLSCVIGKETVDVCGKIILHHLSNEVELFLAVLRGIVDVDCALFTELVCDSLGEFRVCLCGGCECT